MRLPAALLYQSSVREEEQDGKVRSLIPTHPPHDAKLAGKDCHVYRKDEGMEMIRRQSIRNICIINKLTGKSYNRLSDR